MPKSRNRSRDIRKRAAKKRANKIRLARKQESINNEARELELLANCHGGQLVPADGVSHDD